MGKKKMILLVTLILGVCLVAGALYWFVFREEDSSWYVQYEEDIIEEDVFLYYAIKGYNAGYAKREDTGGGFWSATVDGVEAEQWVREYAVAQSKRHLFIEKRFDEEGLTLDEQDLEEIADTVYEDYWYNGLRATYGPMGIDEDAYTQIITVEKKTEKLLAHEEDELVPLITDDLLAVALEEQYASFIFISMYYYSDEEGTSAEADYQALQARIEAGESVLAIAEAFEEAEYPYVTTSIGAEEGRADLAIAQTNIQFPAAFVKELFGASVGDVFYYDDENRLSYNIAVRTDVLEDDYFLEKYRETLTAELLREQFEENLQTPIESASISVNKRNTRKLDLREALA